MRTFIRLAAAAALTLSAALGAAAAPLKVGVAAEPYPPFSEVDAAGTWSGFEIELAQALCAKMQAECETAPVAWDGIIPALTSGQIDMIMNSMSITDERKQTIAFSDRYYYTSAAFVGPKGMAMDTTPEGMKGKVLGVQGSTTHANYAQAKYQGIADVKIYNTQDEANADLAAGRIDATLADQIAMDAFVKSDQGKDMEVKGMAPADPLFGDGIGVGLRKDDGEMLTKVNSGLKALVDSGEYDAIAKKYFDFDIYGPRS